MTQEDEFLILKYLKREKCFYLRRSSQVHVDCYFREDDEYFFYMTNPTLYKTAQDAIRAGEAKGYRVVQSTSYTTKQRKG